MKFPSTFATRIWMTGILLAACTCIANVRANAETDEASWMLDCDNHLIVNPPPGKKIMFGDEGKLSFDPTTGKIASAQMTQLVERLDAMKVAMDGTVAENIALKGELQQVKIELQQENHAVKEQIQSEMNAWTGNLAADISALNSTLNAGKKSKTNAILSARVNALSYHMSLIFGEGTPRLFPSLMVNVGDTIERTRSTFEKRSDQMFYMEYLPSGKYQFEVKGASGKTYTNGGCKGGRGATITATFSSDTPLILLISIGYGGGTDTEHNCKPDSFRQESGGGTFVSLNNFETPLFVAGGGGGGVSTHKGIVEGGDASVTESGASGVGICNWDGSQACRNHGAVGINGQRVQTRPASANCQRYQINPAYAFTDFVEKRGLLGFPTVSETSKGAGGDDLGQPASGYSAGGQACQGGGGGGGGSFAHSDATGVTIAADNTGTASVKITRLDKSALVDTAAGAEEAKTNTPSNIEVSFRSDLDALADTVATLTGGVKNLTEAAAMSSAEAEEDQTTRNSRTKNYGSILINFHTYTYWKQQLSGITHLEGTSLTIDYMIGSDSGLRGNDNTEQEFATFTREMSFVCDLQFLSSIQSVTSLTVMLGMCGNAGDANPFDGFKALINVGTVTLKLEGLNLKEPSYKFYRGPSSFTGLFPSLLSITRGDLSIDAGFGVKEFMLSFRKLEFLAGSLKVEGGSRAQVSHVLDTFSGFDKLKVVGGGIQFGSDSRRAMKITSLSGFDVLEVADFMIGEFRELTCNDIPLRLRNNGGVVRIKGCDNVQCVGDKSGKALHFEKHAGPGFRDFKIRTGESGTFCD